MDYVRSAKMKEWKNNKLKIHNIFKGVFACLHVFLFYRYLCEYNFTKTSLDFIWTMLSIVWKCVHILHIDIGLAGEMGIFYGALLNRNMQQNRVDSESNETNYIFLEQRIKSPSHIHEWGVAMFVTFVLNKIWYIFETSTSMIVFY